MGWLTVALVVLWGPADAAPSLVADPPAASEPAPAPAPAPAPVQHHASAHYDGPPPAFPPPSGTPELRDPFEGYTTTHAPLARVSGDLRDPFAPHPTVAPAAFTPSQDLRDPFESPPLRPGTCKDHEGVPVQRPSGVPCPGRSDPLLRDPFA